MENYFEQFIFGKITYIDMMKHYIIPEEAEEKEEDQE